MNVWTDPAWLARAHAWIRAQAEHAGAGDVGDIEQPHVRPWSTVMRVPTATGDLWFKANRPDDAYEAAVVSLLARRRPDCVPELIAADLESGWMLQRDGGARLRDLIEQERSLDRWLEALPRYAQLQLDVAAHGEELVAHGVPDRRLATLARQYEEMLAALDWLPRDDLDRFRALSSRVTEMCAELAAHDIPETIQHDDFHDAQIFVRDGEYLFFDWGDSCVSHPFFSMSVTLEGVIAWGLDDVDGSEDLARYRDAYLGPFSASRTDLEAALTIALRLGWVCRLLNTHELIEGVDLEEHRKRVVVLFGMFERGLES